MLCAMQGADAFDLDTETFRYWPAGEGVACRLPHAVHTPVLECATTGKMRGMQLAGMPAIPSIRENRFRRCLIGVRRNAPPPSEPDKVDPANGVSIADGALDNKLESGGAIRRYFRNYLIPRQQHRDDREAKDHITSLATSARRQTEKSFRPPAGNARLPDASLAAAPQQETSVCMTVGRKISRHQRHEL